MVWLHQVRMASQKSELRLYSFTVSGQTYLQKAFQVMEINNMQFHHETELVSKQRL